MSDTIHILNLVLEILSKNEVEAERNSKEENSQKNSLDRPKKPPFREGAPQAVKDTILRYKGVIVR